MALAPVLKVCCSPDRKSLRLYDDTGAFSTQNTGGWGTPNPEIAEVTSSLVSITLPNGLVISGINVSTILPNLNGLYFEVTNVMLGLGINDLVPDGIYNVTWNLAGDAFSATYTSFKFITCNGQCCVDKLSAISATDNSKKSKKIRANYSEAFDLLELAKYAAQCGKMVEANQFLIELNLFCESLGCGCGCA